MRQLQVAVIVPTLNESGSIQACLTQLDTLGADEVVVVDAGSDDGTAELARATGVGRVLMGPRHRGRQQNLGAAACTADILGFLHAVTYLEPGAIEELRQFVARHPRVPGGCFRMRVDDPDRRYRLIDAAAHLRAGLVQVPYGDQGLFAVRWAFERAGGFPDEPFMDDVGLALRLRRLGRLAVLPATIYVSNRRWRSQGILRQSLRNWALTGLYALGVPPQTLKRAYPAIREPVPAASHPVSKSLTPGP